MKKWIKELAVDYVKEWDEDRPLFFMISFIIAFVVGAFFLLTWGLILLVITFPVQMLIITGAIFALCLVPVCLFLYGKHVKANE